MMTKQTRTPVQRLIIAWCALLLLLVATYSLAEASASQSPAGGETDVKELVSNIHWLGHDSFRIEGDGLVIYIDPWQLEGGPKADVILITHDHGDHCSPADVDKLKKQDTVIVTIAAAAAKLSGSIKVVKPGDKLTVRGIPISTVPAYNLNKFRSPGVPFHPREANHVGFVITVEGRRIYHAGDTDNIPEMAGIDVDVALLPVSGIYVMTADEAIEAAARIKPEIAIPMHVGRGIGSLSDAESFKEKASVPVEILPMEK
jgi:L-ascorbate metabolism protein UlaG (beta-lactamase superfamily)